MKQISDKRLLCAQGNRTIYYKHGRNYFNEAGTTRFIVSTADSTIEKLLTKCTWVERALRMEPKLAVFIDEECILSHHGGVYRCDWGRCTIEREHTYRKSMNNPVQFCVVKGVQGFEDGILYGEYWGNTDREEVRVFQRVQGRWKTVYTFPAGSITHVHGFVCDRDKNRILILTGDFDGGSGIWEARENFTQVQPLLVGSQQYRCCVAFKYQQGIIYATDTPLEYNAIYFYDEIQQKIEKLQELPGSCIYGREYTDDKGCTQYLFATSVEPDSRITGWKYLLTSKRGQGVRDRYTHIFSGNPESGFKEIYEMLYNGLILCLTVYAVLLFFRSREQEDREKRGYLLVLIGVLLLQGMFSFVFYFDAIATGTIFWLYFGILLAYSDFKVFGGIR